jgi:hypothetical protein
LFVSRSSFNKQNLAAHALYQERCRQLGRGQIRQNNNGQRKTNEVFIGISFIKCDNLLMWETKKSTGIEGLVINPQIKDEAEKNFKNLKDFEKINQGFQIFENLVTLDFYENDSLILSTQDKPKSIIFKSFYLWSGDTLVIDGGIGLFVGAGFSIQIINGKATVYHMLSSDESPTYAYGEKTKLIYRLEVPCHDVMAIISEIPEKEKVR